MVSIVLYFAGALVVLIILSVTPGIKHFIEPVMQLVFWAMKTGAEHSFYWFIWLAKTAWNDHGTVYQHLTCPAEELDLTRAMRENS